MNIKKLKKILISGIPVKLLLQHGEDGTCFDDVRDIPKELDSVKVLGLGTTRFCTGFGFKSAFEVWVESNDMEEK